MFNSSTYLFQNPIFNGKTIFDIATLNIIWRLATGHSFDYEDQLARKTIEHVEAYTMEQTLGTPPIAEILCIKNGRMIVVCGFLMK